MRIYRITRLLLVPMIVLALSSATYAQELQRVYSGYQVVNLATCSGCDAHVRVEYYRPDGGLAAPARHMTIEPGGIANVQLKEQPDLADGVYSAVLSSDRPIAGIATEVDSDPGTSALLYDGPFATYIGKSSGSTTVALPNIDVNWYGFETVDYIQNVGNATANVTVQYKAAMQGGMLAGQASISAQTFRIPKYAAITLDPTRTSSQLVATSGTFQDRFFGSAVVTSDQPLVAVADETDVAHGLKFGYEGFGDGDGGTELLAPAIMWQWYGTYTSLSIMNPSSGSCSVRVVYTAGSGSQLFGGADGAGQTYEVTFSLAAGEMSTRWEGNTAGDLNHRFQRFLGTARISSACSIVAKINQTQYAPNARRQWPSGSYNAVPIAQLTVKVAAPLIQADWYGYFTSLQCANADPGSAARIRIDYRSVGYPKSRTTYRTIPPGGSVTMYEGQCLGPAWNDLLCQPGIGLPLDPPIGGSPAVHFNGAAIITSEWGQKIACTVNEMGGNNRWDNMGTYNAVNILP